MIVLDTTVLVYAVGADHRYREPCRRIIAAIDRGVVAATTTIEVIQEFTHVRARRRGRADAADLARSYVDLLSPLLVVEERDLMEGLRLFERHVALDAFDAVLAAATRTVSAQALVSADHAYSAVPRLEHIVPDEAGVARLLG